MSWYKKIVLWGFCLGMLVIISGCSATKLAISKRNLDVQTRISDTIFLDPPEEKQMKMCIQVKNTSDHQLELIDRITKIMENKGYAVVKSASKAHYLLQVNILFVGKIDISAAEKAFSGGFGSEIASIGSGVATAATVGRGTKTMLAGGIIGGVFGVVADSIVKDVTYTVVADLQISERSANGEIIRQKDRSELKQGNGALLIQKSFGVTNWKRYQTRIISVANKVNLKFEVAKPVLENGLIKAITGIF